MRALQLSALTALAVGAILLNWSAQAATVFCPGTASTSDREFGVTTSGSAGCSSSGNGNSLNATGTDPVPVGIVPIDSTANANLYVGVDGELSIVTVGAMTGTFSFVAPTGYQNFYLGLQTDTPQINPDWAVFALPAGVISGSWQIVNGDAGLVRAILYGQVCPEAGCGSDGGPGPVPLPAAFFLMGTVLAAGGGFAAHRRRRRTAAL
jgi:hypothetical protein